MSEPRERFLPHEGYWSLHWRVLQTNNPLMGRIHSASRDRIQAIHWQESFGRNSLPAAHMNITILLPVYKFLPNMRSRDSRHYLSSRAVTSACCRLQAVGRIAFIATERRPIKPAIKAESFPSLMMDFLNGKENNHEREPDMLYLAASETISG